MSNSKNDIRLSVIDKIRIARIQRSTRSINRGRRLENERVIKALSEIAWISIAKTDDGSRLVATHDLIDIIRLDTKE